MSTAKLTSKSSLLELESKLDELLCSRGPHTVWLPRQKLDRVVFRSAWIFAFLVTLEKDTLTVIDWAQTSTDSDAAERFLSTIEGIASIRSASRIVSAQRDQIAINNADIIRRLEEHLTIEARERKTKLSIVAWDPSHSVPKPFLRVPAGNAAIEYNEWTESFFGVVEPLLPRNMIGTEKIARDARHINKGTVKEKVVSSEIQFRRFVYELFNNTLVHGRKEHISKGQDELLRGPRYISVAKVVCANQEDLQRRAGGFKELETYFQRFGTKARFAEISIGDIGMGVIRRFTSKTSTELPVSPDRELQLLNKIIDENLSSNRSDPGSGRGFERVLNAMKFLDAFITVRTNRVWAHYAPQLSPNELTLSPVHVDKPVADIRGTHIGILVPLKG